MLDDAAQGFGATYKNRRVGTLAPATATSFFPAKPLGCYGDGGAVLTDDEELAAVLRSLRVHGEGRDKYDNVRIGLTGRLDTIQAAVLIEKLKIFPDEIVARERIARALFRGPRRCRDRAAGRRRARPRSGRNTPSGSRPGGATASPATLKAQGIPTAIYYPNPLHRQRPTSIFRWPRAALPVSERLADEVISLPMHAYLDEATQDRIIEAVRRALAV